LCLREEALLFRICRLKLYLVEALLSWLKLNFFILLALTEYLITNKETIIVIIKLSKQLKSFLAKAVGFFIMGILLNQGL